MNAKPIRLDGKKLFDGGEPTWQLASWRRQTLERSFAGVDGVLSIDLGRRQRTLKQRGWLTAASKASLRKRCEEILAHIDGFTHELIDGDGTVYPQVRMDSFKLLSEVYTSNPVRCEYEIIYSQLGE
ncbi:MAG: hypothetical protein JW810_03815 [Sedimentisphaerales bacterium]|nr:hypothetical protein [Sedimentisphaerales bacterium]